MFVILRCFKLHSGHSHYLNLPADVLYERLVLGKPQRTLPREAPQPLSTTNELLPESSHAGSERWSKGE